MAVFTGLEAQEDRPIRGVLGPQPAQRTSGPLRLATQQQVGMGTVQACSSVVFHSCGVHALSPFTTLTEVRLT